MRTLFSLLVLAVGLTALVPASDSTEMIEARAIIGMLGEEECEFHCDLDCPGNEHDIRANPLGNDAVVDEIGEHECLMVNGGCAVHTCSGGGGGLSLVPADFYRLEDVLRKMDRSDLSALIAAESRVRLNSLRNAVQVLGCFDEVVVSVNLTPDRSAV